MQAITIHHRGWKILGLAGKNSPDNSYRSMWHINWDLHCGIFTPMCEAIPVPAINPLVHTHSITLLAFHLFRFIGVFKEPRIELIVIKN